VPGLGLLNLIEETPSSPVQAFYTAAVDLHYILDYRAATYSSFSRATAIFVSKGRMHMRIQLCLVGKMHFQAVHSNE
jgi:hypothetical protein